MKTTSGFLKKCSFVVFGSVLFFLLPAITIQAQEEVKSSLKLIETGQSPKAVEVLTKAITEQPEAITLYYYLGYAQLKAGENDRALETFEKGIARNDKEPLLYAGKGHVLLIKNNEAEGKALVDKAMGLGKGKNVAALQAVGRAYLANPKFVKDALAVLEKAKSLQLDNPETYLLLGDAYLMQNNGGSAVSNYEWATHYDPTSAVALHRAGSVYLRTKDYKVAEEAFLKAVSVDPSFGPAYEELAELSYLGRNGARAVQYFEKYLSLTGNQEKDQVKYAFYLFMAKDFTKANEIFDRLAKQQNVSAVTLRYYAFSLFEAGAFLQSKSIFDRYFATAGKQEFEAADYAYYGKLLSKLNQDSLAAESMSKSLSMEKNQPELTRLLAETQYKRKKYPEAIELYKQLMSGQKVLSQDYYSIGRAYYFNNQFEQADSSFLKLVELQPQMTVSFLWEGRTKANLDPETEKGLAKPYYEKLIELSLQKPDKSKNELIEAYSYLGYYHFLKGEVPVSKSYWNKVLALNPNDEKAKEAIRAFK